MHYLSKKSIFDFFILQFKSTSFSCNNSKKVNSDQEAVNFFEFPIVELTILSFFDFEKFLNLKLNVLKNAFGTRTL
jgi:hypothetical protein